MAGLQEKYLVLCERQANLEEQGTLQLVVDALPAVRGLVGVYTLYSASRLEHDKQRLLFHYPNMAAQFARGLADLCDEKIDELDKHIFPNTEPVMYADTWLANCWLMARTGAAPLHPPEPNNPQASQELKVMYYKNTEQIFEQFEEIKARYAARRKPMPEVLKEEIYFSDRRVSRCKEKCAGFLEQLLDACLAMQRKETVAIVDYPSLYREITFKTLREIITTPFNANELFEQLQTYLTGISRDRYTGIGFLLQIVHLLRNDIIKIAARAVIGDMYRILNKEKF